MLYTIALARAPRGVLANSHALRPITKGLMLRSLRNPKHRITQLIHRNIKSSGLAVTPVIRAIDVAILRIIFTLQHPQRILMVKI